MTDYRLLPCRHRGLRPSPGRYECRSPLRLVPEGSVPDHWCMTCAVRDLAAPGAPVRSCPCAGQVRHLAYHVWPHGGEWEANLTSLRRRLSLFNGLRVFSVATGPDSASPAEVERALDGFDCVIMRVDNDANLREMASYPGLMRRLSPFRSDADCHWYGHAKGVSSIKFSAMVREWRECMYEAQLDYWPAMQGLLSRFAAVGQFIRPAHIIPESPCKWHFSGTFSWRRHLPLFQREWDNYDQHWCGSESHLGRILERAEVANLYGEHCGAGLGLYLQEVWDGGMRAQHQQWTRDHASDLQAPLLATVILTAARQAELVHEAIESVRQQTVDSWQCLIVDAGELSAAGAYDRYAGDARISVMPTGESAWQRSRLCIQGWAINEAWRRGRVRGDLVCCLSDDDQLAPGWLAACLSAAREHPDQAAWVGPVERSAVAGDGQVQQLGRLDAQGVYGPGRPLRGRLDGMQLCVRRHAWRNWPEERARAREADGWWMDAVAAATPVHALPDLVGHHRHTPLSTWTTAAGRVGSDG